MRMLKQRIAIADTRWVSREQREERRSDAGELRHKLYRTRAWQRLRSVQLDRHPVCAECERQGRLVPATVADHREGHGKGWQERFWRLEALQSLCKPCHDHKTAHQG